MIKVAYSISHAEPDAVITAIRDRCLELGFSAVGDVSGTTFNLAPGPGAGIMVLAIGKNQPVSNSIGIQGAGDDARFAGQYLAVIGALDTAAALGCRVQVFDEGGYWEHRDLEKALSFKQKVENLPDPREMLPYL